MANNIQPIAVTSLPAEGYLRLEQIIGQKEVSEAEAEANRIEAEQKRKAEDAAGRKPKHCNKPKRPRKPTAPIIPVSRSTWLNGVRSGKFPKPVKLGPRTTVWRVEDIRALIATA